MSPVNNALREELVIQVVVKDAQPLSVAYNL